MKNAIKMSPFRRTFALLENYLEVKIAQDYKPRNSNNQDFVRLISKVSPIKSVIIP